MRILPVLVFCLCLFLCAGHARALSDVDHSRFTREFPAYAMAEKRLNAVWKQLKRRLSKEEFRTLLAEQRAWVTSARDAEARALAGPGPFADAAPLANAYASVTLQRAKALEERITPDRSAARPDTKAKNPSQAREAVGAPGKQGLPAPRDKTPEAGQGAVAGKKSLPQPPGASSTSAVVGSYGSGGNLVEVKTRGKGYYVAVSASSADARAVCEMEGLGVLEGDILRITSVSSGKSVVVPIRFFGDSLIIPATEAAICSSGGSIDGVYKRK